MENMVAREPVWNPWPWEDGTTANIRSTFNFHMSTQNVGIVGMFAFKNNVISYLLMAVDPHDTTEESVPINSTLI